MSLSLSPEVECTSCGTKKCDWVTRVKNKGECYDCFYKKLGLENPKKKRERVPGEDDE